MRRRHVMLLVATLVMALAAALPAAGQTTEPPYRLFLPTLLTGDKIVTLNASADAFVFENGPTFNTGKEEFLLAGNDQSEQNPLGISRSLFAFELPALASGSVQRAVFRVYYSGYGDFRDEPRTVELYALLSGWQEDAVNWSNQPARSLKVGSALIVANDNWRYIEFDITPLVSEWVNQQTPNYGLTLVGPESAGSDWSYRVFDSRETARPPQLILTLN